MRDKRTAHAEARMLKQPCSSGTSGAPVCLEHSMEERISAAEAGRVRRQELEGSCVLREAVNFILMESRSQGRILSRGLT